ncbi:MAG TPA: hypothetical protein VLZ30_02055, partial [Verrucomicrobiae bacterium]|nr:hypothetical protein [Verrucomicrobiae bacterium]
MESIVMALELLFKKKPLEITSADWLLDGVPADQDTELSHFALTLPVQIFVVSTASTVPWVSTQHPTSTVLMDQPRSLFVVIVIASLDVTKGGCDPHFSAGEYSKGLQVCLEKCRARPCQIRGEQGSLVGSIPNPEGVDADDVRVSG